MCDPVSAIVGSAVIGAGSSAIQGSASRKQARRAQAANEASAERARQSSEIAYNRANQRMPNIAALFANNKQFASKGLGGTFLTGAGGVSPTSLPLGGAATLLGS
jgi:hypothetical protein